MTLSPTRQTALVTSIAPGPQSNGIAAKRRYCSGPGLTILALGQAHSRARALDRRRAGDEVVMKELHGRHDRSPRAQHELDAGSAPDRADSGRGRTLRAPGADAARPRD